MDYSNLHKCLFSTELFDKPPKIFNNLKEKIEKYVNEFINKNPELVKNLNIKNHQIFSIIIIVFISL